MVGVVMVGGATVGDVIVDEVMVGGATCTYERCVGQELRRERELSLHVQQQRGATGGGPELHGQSAQGEDSRRGYLHHGWRHPL